MAAEPRFAPEVSLRVGGNAAPAALRASIASVSWQSGLEGADRVELNLVNDKLRWLDHELLALDQELTLSIGYAPDALEQVFVGEIVGQSAAFPSGGVPTLTVVAHDRRHRLQQGTKSRWFAIPIRCTGNWPMSDPTVASLVSIERELIPIFDPLSAALSLAFSAVDVVVQLDDPIAVQKVIRKQADESDYDFLRRIARENAWEMLIEHEGPAGGHLLRFMSPADRLAPVATLKYGQSLIDFTPRLTSVGQIAGISARFWRPEIKMDFTVNVSWDWDRSSLDISISPGFGGLPVPTTADASVMLLEEPLTQATAARVILGKLLGRLNQRLTGSGSTIGDPRLRAGRVVRLEGVGERFGGLYRVTSATHTLDSGGYRTQFEVRKEIWFGSIPLFEQGAVRIRLQGESIAAGKQMGAS